MTEVSFYTGVAERLAYVCRLLRKAQQSGARVIVVGPAAALDRLDAALWTFEAIEFVPHLRLRGGAQPAALARTPVLLTDSLADMPSEGVLLNLGAELVPGFERFKRVLEVVSQDAQQVQAGRERFKQYKKLGHPVVHHEVGA